ncbi:MAG: translation initiation factor IF-2 N-terminal domain-containing protein, partial [candidate division WOR-3 bacterium]|nr:translation initiation factor IF-2 N-terminal domain-containing protein [candidate division WOR-3 bacterium]
MDPTNNKKNTPKKHKTTAADKPRSTTRTKKTKTGIKVFEAANRLNLSCEALVTILKRHGCPPRGYTSLITPEELELVKNCIRKEKIAYKESLKKKQPTPEATTAIEKPPTPDIKKAIKETLVKIEHRQPKPHYRHIEKPAQTEPVFTEKKIKVAPYVSVAELAHLFNISPAEIIKKCIALGMPATLNQRLDPDTIALLADEFKVKVEIEEEIITPEVQGEMKERPPVVVVM